MSQYQVLSVNRQRWSIISHLYCEGTKTQDRTRYQIKTLCTLNIEKKTPLILKLDLTEIDTMGEGPLTDHNSQISDRDESAEVRKKRRGK